jgi:hypothetical protein
VEMHCSGLCKDISLCGVNSLVLSRKSENMQTHSVQNWTSVLMILITNQQAVLPPGSGLCIFREPSGAPSVFPAHPSQGCALELLIAFLEKRHVSPFQFDQNIS